MNIKFQRAVDRFAGVPICALLSLIEFLRGRPAAASPPRRILVILLSEMGSLVLAQPMFAHLKQRYPDASIHVLLFARNREMLELLGEIPAANVLTLDDRSLTGFAADSVRAIRRLRALKLDAVIDCELFARVSSIFSYLSNAPVRVGFHRHTQEGLYRGSFINRAVMYNPYRHLSQQFLTMVAALDSDTVPVAKLAPEQGPGQPPQLAFAEGELERIATQLHADFPAVQGKRLVLVYPSGGLLPIRAWPLEYYYQLCKSLLDEGYAIGIIGLKEDKSIGQAVAAYCRSPHCVDLTGYTKSVRHLLALFHRASLLVTNDGGPGQFAALTPVPAIIFFGPETPVLYRSLARNAYCFHLSLPCSPCLTAYNHRTSPCDGDNQCLKQIAPEQVLAKAREMLGDQDEVGTLARQVA
jgi:lipopolysaccharide heptosyltransferase II